MCWKLKVVMAMLAGETLRDLWTIIEMARS